MDKEKLNKLDLDLKGLRADFMQMISDKENRMLIQKKTGVSVCNLLNYSSGLKNISDNKIIEIYKKIL